MCLFPSKSKSNKKILDAKEKPPSIVSLPSASPSSSGVTGKRRSNQTLANPNPKSSENSLSVTSPMRSSREERRLPMPRKTPGGLPRDLVVLGAPAEASRVEGGGQGGRFP